MTLVITEIIAIMAMISLITTINMLFVTIDIIIQLYVCLSFGFQLLSFSASTSSKRIKSKLMHIISYVCLHFNLLSVQFAFNYLSSPLP